MSESNAERVQRLRWQHDESVDWEYKDRAWLIALAEERVMVEEHRLYIDPNFSMPDIWQVAHETAYADGADLSTAIRAVADMIKDVENGIYIVGDGSFSIDQQRYNAQFGGTLFYEIKNGKIGEQLEDVAYQSNTQEFWNACSATCDERDWRLGGSFFDGKGQPSQSSAVSHGSSTTRFNGINVINTARKIA